MIRSMTGYGKAQTSVEGKKFTVEIRSVNGKTADISFKTSQIPRDMEPQLRASMTQCLQRGNIDLYITTETDESSLDNAFNAQLIEQYYRELKGIFDAMGQEVGATELASAVLRMSEVRDTRRKEMSQEEWNQLSACIQCAVTALDEFRLKEGARLADELLSHVDLIEKYLNNVIELDPERIVRVREKLEERLQALSNDITIDRNRLEQELIYYLEKADITEEKVRLNQHCSYFRQTMQEELYAGRKLGFIAQEMGREINTLGSKASHAPMQQLVVKMKDELEKIKEQVLNVL